MTSLTGVAVMSRGLVLALGCGNDHPTLCTGGIISLSSGLVGVIPGIWLTATSGARAEVVPAWQAFGSAGGPGIYVGPGGIAGSF